MRLLLCTGANGRIGRLLRPLTGEAAHWAQRGPGADLDWSPLAGPAPLVAHCARHGAPSALVQLARGTPCDPACDDAAIARATIAAARAAGIPCVFLASSSAVYGHGRATPWAETDRAEPVTPYGLSKRAMETAADTPGVTCLRIGNVAGADALLTNPSRPLRLDCFPDGTNPIRSYIGPATLARVLIALARAPALPRILNLAAPQPVSMADLAGAAGLPVTRHPAPPGAIARLTLDTARLQALVPFTAADSTPAGIVAQWRRATEPA